MISKSIFTPDFTTDKRGKTIDGGEIIKYKDPITRNISSEMIEKGDRFAREIKNRFVADFENKDTDKMVHVSTFAEIDRVIYMTYYAN